MGRYTSMQGFSDQNTKIVASTSTSTSSNNNGESTNQSSHATSTGGPSNKLIVDKVQFTQGSCAGAGSGEFDKYRAARNRELQRLKDIELKDKAIVEEQLYQARINKNKQEAEERTNKNRQKRDKKKMKLLKKKEFKKSHKEDGSNNDDSVEGDDQLHANCDGDDDDDEVHDLKKQKTSQSEN